MKKVLIIFKLIKDGFQKVLKSNNSTRITVCYLIFFLILAVPFVFYEIVYAKTINLGEADDIIYIEGNVGIGTTSPGYKLDIEGFINTKSIHKVSDEGLVLAMNFSSESLVGTAGSETVLDASGYNNHGTNHGATHNVTGGFNGGGVLEFNGTSDYINCGTDPSLDFEDGSFTISAWIKADATTGAYAGIVTRRGGSGGYYQFSFHNNSSIIMYACDPSCYSVSLSINTGQWYHVVTVIDRDSNLMKVSIDGGQSFATRDISSMGSVGNNTDPVRIGWERANDSYFDGSIDNVRIYNRALSVNEIKQLHLQRQESLDSYVYQKDIYITNNGNVGIGTTSPGYKLDVQGTGRFTNPVIVGTPTGDTHAATKSYVDSAAGGGVGAGSSGQTLRHDGTSWVGSSVLYNNGTNVGIGTTSPGGKLDVSGGELHVSGVASPLIWLQSTADGTPYGFLQYESEGGAMRIYDGSSYTMHWKAGSVGIGTTSPGYKLDVSGTGRFTNPVIVGTPTGDTHAATKSYVDSAAGGGVGAGSSGQTLRHDGTSWVGSSLLYNNGTNVGIGITNPQAPLHLLHNLDSSTASVLRLSNSKSIQSIVGIEFWGSAAGATTYNTARIEAQFGSNYNYDTARLSFLTPTGVGTWDKTMTLINGNVGIGTTSPGYKLDVSGNIRVANGSDIYIQRSRYGYSASYEAVQIGKLSGSTDSVSIALGIDPNSNPGSAFTGNEIALPNFVEFMQTNSDNTNWIQNVLVLSNSNIGIGVSPSYKLDVSGTGRFTNPVIVGTPTADTHAATKSYVDSAAGGGVGAGSSGQTLRHDGTSWVASSLLYNNGTNIGIGTTSPSDNES